MDQMLGLFSSANDYRWALVDSGCTLLLLMALLVILLTQHGPNRQRRWAALGPLAAAIFAAVIALGTWVAERTLAMPGGLCHFAGPACFFAQGYLEQQQQLDIMILAWLIVAMAIAFAFIVAAMLVSNDKPVGNAAPQQRADSTHHR